MSFIGAIFQRLVSSDIVPWFLKQKNIGTFLESVALTFDSATETLAQGLRLSQPLRCDESALPILARDRGIRLYATEPVASKRLRLSRWLQLRRQFGTHQGQLRNIQPFFLGFAAVPRLRIVHQRGDGASATWHTLEPDGTYSVHRAIPSNWDWDGVPAKWSRYWLIVYTTALGLPAQPTWGGGQLWDGGDVWDGLLTAAQIDDIAAGVLEARARHTQLWGVIFAPDDASFDPTAAVVVNGDGTSNLPDGLWGYVIDNTTGQPSRLAGASFAYDLGQG